jgi:hypothetical protein
MSSFQDTDSKLPTLMKEAAAVMAEKEGGRTQPGHPLHKTLAHLG